MKYQLSIFLIFSCSLLTAQLPEWKMFSKVTSVEALAKDDNFIWAGTNAGIVKINKITGERSFLDKSNSIVQLEFINQIVVDENEHLWIKSGVRQLLKFDGVEWTVFDTTNSPFNENVSLENISVGNGSDICVATSKGLFIFDGNSWIVYNTSNSGLPQNYLHSVFADGDTIWISSNSGLTRFDGVNWTTFDTSNSNFSGRNVIKMEKDISGNLWFLHYDGLEKFDGNTFTSYGITTNTFPYTSLCDMDIDENGNVWVCGVGIGDQGGIMYFDGSSWIKYDTENSEIADVDVKKILIEDADNIWYGCYNKDIVGLKNGIHWMEFITSSSDLRYPEVHMIANDIFGHAYLAAYQQGGIYSRGVLTSFDWYSFDSIRHYDYYTQQIGTDNRSNFYQKREGLWKYDGFEWIEIPLSEKIAGYTEYWVYEDLNCLNLQKDGEIWMDVVDTVVGYYDPNTGVSGYVAYEGVAHYDGINWIVYKIGAFDIELDKQNNVWFAGNMVLTKFDGQNWTHYYPSLVNKIKSFVIDSIGHIWMSGNGGDFLEYDLEKITVHSSPVYCYSADLILIDTDGTLWQKNQNGLIHFDGENWSYFNNWNSPILPGLRSFSIDKYGNKWIGTNYGFSVYNKNGIVTKSETQMKANDEITVYPNPFKEQFHLILNHNISDFYVNIFDVASRLIHSQHFSGSDEKTISVSNLPPGVYFYQIITNGTVYSNGKIISH